MYRKILHGIAVTASPLWFIASTSVLPSKAEQSNVRPLLAEAVYPQLRETSYYEQPAVYFPPFPVQCADMSIPARFCQRWIQEVYDYKRQWHPVPPPDLLLERLKRLDASARKRLGGYWEADYNRQNQRLQSLGISPQEADATADDRFYLLFPEHGSRIIPPEQMNRQIWFALREEVIRRWERRTPDRSQPRWY
jgi:hypothetical protein